MLPVHGDDFSSSRSTIFMLKDLKQTRSIYFYSSVDRVKSSTNFPKRDPNENFHLHLIWKQRLKGEVAIMGGWILQKSLQLVIHSNTKSDKTTRKLISL